MQALSRALLAAVLLAILPTASPQFFGLGDPCKVDYQPPGGPPFDADLRTEDPRVIYLKLKGLISTYAGFIPGIDPARDALRAVKEAISQCDVYSIQVAFALSNPQPPQRAASTSSRDFGTPSAVARSATDWTLVDLNRDGLLDGVQSLSDQIVVQLATPSGLGAARILNQPSNFSLRRVVSADFNGDSNPDLALCCTANASSLVLLPGDGRGGFGSPITLMPATVTVFTADWNRDGKADLFSFNAASEPYVALGNGDGTFQVPRTGATLFRPSTLLVADATGDARPDLIAMGEAQVAVYPNAADATLLPAVPTTLATREATGFTFALAGDLNGDGRLDLAANNPTHQLLTVMLGNGTGAFPEASLARSGTATGFFSVATDLGPTSTLLVPDGPSSSFMLFPIQASQPGRPLRSGPALLRLPDEGTLNFRGRAIAAVGDLNRDGRTDAIVADTAGNQIRMRAFLSPGLTPQALVRAAIPSRTPSFIAAYLADFNNDNNTDAALVNGGAEPSLLFYAGRGNGQFADPVTLVLPLPPTAAAIGDFNGDSRPDLALGSHTFGSPAEVLIVSGGASGFTAPVRVPLDAARPTAIAAGDVNGDQRADLVVASQDQNSFVTTARVLLGAGNSQFTNAATLNVASGSTISAIAIANLDADPANEIVVGTEGVSVYKAQGSAFTRIPTDTTFGSASSLLLRDFNSDGKLDLLLGACCGEVRNELHLGRGDGTFLPTLPTIPMDSKAVFATDLDADGKFEIAQLFDGGLVIAPGLTRSIATSVSAASFRDNALAPASIASAFGNGLASTSAGATELNQTSIAGTSVTIIDRTGQAFACPLFYVSPGQVNYLIPAGLADGSALVHIRSGDTGIVSPVQVKRVAPGLFLAGSTRLLAGEITRVSGGTQTRQDLVTLSGSTLVPVPIDLGPPTDTVVLTIFGTGLRNRTALNQVSVRIADQTLAAAFAGAQGSFQGLDQVNVTLPRALAGAGQVEVSLLIDGVASNAGTITIR